jgi:integrase
MSKSNGIFQRGSSHYLRVVLPKTHPLRSSYKSGKVVISLGACSYREALTLAVIKRANIMESTESIKTQTIKSNLVSSKRTPSAYYLRDVFERWRESKPRSSDAINACMRALLLYEEQTKNPLIHEITRAQGDSFRAWLQQPERKTTSKTAYDRFTWVKTLLKYAYLDLEFISRHPWEGIELVKETTNRRRPWTNAELLKLFGQDLFTKHKLPSDKKSGFDAAYWIPLLGIYTGARLSELVQLQIKDVLIKDDIPVISISNLGTGQQLKTSASVRTIPIHSELIRLGFLNYLDNIRNEGHESLWPKLNKRKDKPGGYFSNWFSEFRNSIGLTGYPDFHCFRHTVRSQL